MNTWLAVVGILGGAFTFLGAVYAIVRNIVRQVGATETNSKALGDLQAALQVNTKKTDELSATVQHLSERLAIQTDRISRLERTARNGLGKA